MDLVFERRLALNQAKTADLREVQLLMRFTKGRRFEWLLVSGIVMACTLVMPGCGGEERSYAPTVSLAELQGIEDLRIRFVNDAGSQRVILLLSPT